MPEWVAMGSEGHGYSVVFDFRKWRTGECRGMVRANTALVQGTPLELIPAGKSGYEPGMVLVHQKWQELYFLIERDGWEEQDYFDYAEKRFKELHVERP